MLNQTAKIILFKTIKVKKNCKSKTRIKIEFVCNKKKYMALVFFHLSQNVIYETIVSDVSCQRSHCCNITESSDT